MAFLAINISTGQIAQFWPELLTEDGHPMFCPSDRNWLSVDTYPDTNRVRQLRLLNAITGEVVDLGQYQFADQTLAQFLPLECFEHADPVVLRNVEMQRFAFARSGLHCDLHPRWKGDGSALAFDSTHEGTRQIYVVDTSAYVSTDK